MQKLKNSFYERFLLGYSFNQEREAFSLIAINYFLIILFGFVVILLHAYEKDLLTVSYRYHTIILLSLLNLWLLRKRMINPARILILVSLPVLILILPPLGGAFSDEFYFWFPYIPIGLSILPHFILHPFRQRIQLYFTLLIYLLLCIFIDSYLIYLSEGSEKIIPIVIENRFYYKLIPAFLFLFVNLALRLLFVKNFQFKTIMDTQYEELVQTEKMASLGILTSGLAHEINNPLNFISGSLNALHTLKEKYLSYETEPSAEKKEVLKRIEQVMESAFDGIERASSVISKLDFFAHPKAKQDRKEISMDKLIESALSSIESRLPYYIRLTTDIEKDLKVLCHEQQLKLVFTYILRNAFDALESKERVEREKIDISATRVSSDRRPYTRISFCNSGPAIPEEDIKHIFDPFFSSRETGEGIGLGMSLSYMIIKEHGGKLEVKNQAGVVRFDIFLPAWAESGSDKVSAAF
jgi:signal transduction histidine kinase